MDAARDEAFFAVFYGIVVGVAEIGLEEEAGGAFLAGFVDGAFSLAGYGSETEAVASSVGGI